MYPERTHKRGQPEDEEFMKISDYSQGKQSNQNSSEVEDYPIQQFQNYLSKNGQNFSKPESYYQEKIESLQKQCQKYYSACENLTKNIEDLENQIEQHEETTVDIQEIYKVVEWLETEVAQYKDQFIVYRQKQNSFNVQKNHEFEHLQKSFQLLKDERDMILREKQSLEDKNIELENENGVLMNEIQNLEEELHNLKEFKSVSRMKTSKRTVFDDEIQLELQNLIEKLMNELDSQRNNNRKSIEQIKRMQEEILQLQRQIVNKNNKIYSLQMNNIKSKRQSPKNQSKLYMFQRNKSERDLIASPERREQHKSKSDRSNVLRNIRLEDIFSDNLEVSEKERYMIASKLAFFYLRKYDSSDYEPFNPDQLFICNYNKTNPSLITIKKDPDNPPYRQKTNPKVLSWNLGILLSKLLIEPTYQSEFTDESIEIVHKSIDRFVQLENPNSKSVREIKGMLDEILKSIE